jgi:hypothetical protein
MLPARHPGNVARTGYPVPEECISCHIPMRYTSWSPKMDLSFADAALAALCNSEGRLAERWGPEVARLIARRLLELAATDADAVERLPRAQVRAAEDTGETIIDFGGGDMVFRGEIHDGTAAGSGKTESRTHMLITGLDVRGSIQS